MAFDVLILHGKPPREKYDNPDLPKPHEANWLPWLQQELAKRGISAAIPEFPEPYFPQYEPYVAEFERYTINAETSIVTHSVGADFSLRYLSENTGVELRQLLLVAPWTDSSKKYGDFSNYTLDKQLANRIGRIVIINSRDDSDHIQDNVRYLRDNLSVDYVELDGFGHFMLDNKMTDEAFPELLSEMDIIKS